MESCKRPLESGVKQREAEPFERGVDSFVRMNRQGQAGGSLVSQACCTDHLDNDELEPMGHMRPHLLVP